MQTREIDGAVHNIFKDQKEFESFFLKKDGVVPKLVKDWKNGRLNDWILADDGGVTQIIKITIPKIMQGRHLVYTPVGLFVAIHDNKKRFNLPYFMDTDIKKHPCRKRFDGKFNNTVEGRRKKKISPKDKLFSLKIAMGIDPYQAVREVYQVQDIERKLRALIYSKRVMKMVQEDMRKVAKEKGYDDEYIFKKLDELIGKSKDDRVTLETIVQFGKIIGTISNEPKPIKGFLGGSASALFHGFSPRSLEEADNVDVEEENVEDVESES